MNKNNQQDKAAIPPSLPVISLVVGIFIGYIFFGLNVTTLESGNESLELRYTGQPNISCNTEELNLLREDIKNINIPSCPSCKCPTYTPAVCNSTIINNTNMLMLDKFKFRYDMIQDRYAEVDDKLEDGNIAYCYDNLAGIYEEYDLAFSYVSEYYTKTKFGTDSQEKLSYDILISGNDYFKDYTIEVRAYCKDPKNKVSDGVYNNYKLYLEYYNELSANSTMPRVQILKELETD